MSKIPSPGQMVDYLACLSYPEGMLVVISVRLDQPSLMCHAKLCCVTRSSILDLTKLDLSDWRVGLKRFISELCGDVGEAYKASQTEAVKHAKSGLVQAPAINADTLREILDAPDPAVEKILGDAERVFREALKKRGI